MIHKMTAIFGFLLVILYGNQTVAAADNSYICINDEIRFGSNIYSLKTQKGWGKVKITTSKSFFASDETVNYDDRFTIKGDLKEDHDIFIKQDLWDSPFPWYTYKLLMDRATGDGYFQVLTYACDDCMPSVRTENLTDCKIGKNRF